MVITLRTMVRPWMVALLMLLTDRDRSFSHGSAAHVVGVAPATTDEDVDVDAASINATEIASVGCNYKGRSYDPGSLVNTDQPCLKCTCVTGSLVCHLQVCPELPDPPPPGCVIVHKKNKCCAHLQCYYEQFDAVHAKLFSLQNRSGPARMDNSAIVTFDGLPKGCVINGTIYAEGSAMDSSSLCEYCYCIKGHQQCVRPQCSLTIPGCTAVYKKHTCCPIRYKCSPLQNAQIKNTTDATTTEMTSSLSARLKDCRINGRLISLGEPVIGVARSSCETCFCINGQVRCDKVICPPIRAQISPNCGPVYSEGHCCPTSYNCSSTTSNNESHISPTVTPTTTTSIGVVATMLSSTVTVDDAVLLSSSSSPSPLQTPTVAQMLLDTDSASSSITVDSKNTTDQITEEPIESRHGNPDSLMHDDFGRLNVTEKSNNFEMDYDDPTLPPSLPNLKIIPFVAADAVVDEPVAAYENYQPMVERVYNVSDVEEPPLPVVNSFSPPIETEGGFVPKDSPNGAIYTPDKFRKTTEQPTIHHDEPIVEHQPIRPVWCISNGKKYKHGELLTDPSACNICICFNAKIVCQENCPAVKVGCQRINDPNNSTCCGRIVCDEYENDITTEHMKQIEVTSETTTTTTTMDIRDAVIEHIFYSTPPTEKLVITSSLTTLKSFHMSPETTSLKPTTSTVKLIETLAPTTEKSSVISSTIATIKRTESTTSAPKPLEDEDYSFESMFSFLFNGDTPEQSSSPPSLSSPTNNMESETRIEHRTDDEIDEKVHLIDTKHEHTDLMSLHKPQHKPILNSDTEMHSEDKHNKVEPQEVYKPIESRPNTEIKQHDNDKPNSETKYFIDNKPSQSGIKQHVDVKSHQEIKPDATSSGIKQQAEVKTHFDVKENVQVTSPFNLKPYDEVNPSYHDFSNHQTEVKSHFSVKDNPELKTHTDSKFQSDDKMYADFKHQSDINTHFDVKKQDEVKPYFDFKQQTEIKQHSNFKQQVDLGLQSEFKQHTEVKPNIVAAPLKTKVDSEFNLLASMLKISGCNIYGRMYRVGKIISELSNPCLECMCTEIGVHCNQLKC
ncbi:uncharacterized protein LOC113560277 isoform X1 [Rhopalosiphum maidis]|uniref:uncharacterized protein LOC113560277 isoform X1 n=1 Tax=Rhopalosiphum maidis TaxID=43146 RepID=UPI000EFF58FE|nr:uncharacterized protein LOC113560277 isoform X1 [Rhopalosiphum maidis]